MGKETTDAIKLFFGSAGLPPEMAEGAAADPGMQAIAHTMPYDYACVGDGGAIPEARARAIAVPALVLAGGASAPFFRDTAARLGAIMPDARVRILDGAGHDAPADVLAPPIKEFLQA